MGLWDTLGKVAKTVGDQAKKGINDMQTYKEKYASYSDEQLLSKVRKTCSIENAVILSILRERGYDGKKIAEIKGWNA